MNRNGTARSGWVVMMATGRMHTYMLMYWGKKVLEWTPEPA